MASSIDPMTFGTEFHVGRCPGCAFEMSGRSRAVVNDHYLEHGRAVHPFTLTMPPMPGVSGSFPTNAKAMLRSPA